MADRKYLNHVPRRKKPIQGDITGSAVRDYQFTQVRAYDATNQRMITQQLDCPADGGDCSSSRTRIVFSQERKSTLQAG